MTKPGKTKHKKKHRAIIPVQRVEAEVIYARHANAVTEPVLDFIEALICVESEDSENKSEEVRAYRREELKNMSRERYIAPQVKMGGNNPGYVRHGKLMVFSPEVISHAEFLRETKGEQAVREYLDGIRNGGTMSTEPVRIDEQQAPRPTTTIGSGAIETALADAKSKATEMRKMAQQFADEASRQELIIAKLQQSLDLLGVSRAEIRSRISGVPQKAKRIPGQRNDWGWILKEILKDGQGKTPHQIRKEIYLMKPDANSGNLYNVLYRYQQTGVLIHKPETDQSLLFLAERG